MSYLISILKSDRSRNFKHQFSSEIENFINTNPKNLTEDLISEYGIYEFSNDRFKNSIKFLREMKSREPSSFIGVTMATMLPLNIFINIPYVVARGHTFKIVLINTARGIAKKTPQIPHTDPKNNIDNSIANG